MKRSLNLKNLVAMILVSCVVFLASCVKNRNDGAVDFSQLTPIVLIPEGGLKNFATSALLFNAADASDTAVFRVNYAATTVAPADITVTLAVDPAALAAYNASEAARLAAMTPPQAYSPYAIFPDSIYKFTTTTVTIKAGQSYSDAIKLTLYPIKVDPSKNYMLPISITNASGVNISGNFNTIYFHFIGNCLAGTYNVVGTRYNYNGGSGFVCGGPIPPATAGTAASPAVKVLAPLSSTVTVTDYANLGPGTNRDYYFTYDCSTGGNTLQDVTFTPAFLAGISNVVVCVKSYDPVLRKIHVLSMYNNLPGGAGSDRVVDEVFTHQ